MEVPVMRRRGAVSCQATAARGRSQIAWARASPSSLARLAALGALAGFAGCGYRPGSFAGSEGGFVGERTTVACLDVAIERRPDLSIGPVLKYQFANRCDHTATVDLGAAGVVGRTVDGADVALRPYDPRAELHPVVLDGRNVGSEALAYPADRAMSQLCVDVAALVRDRRDGPDGRDGTPRWLCLGGPGPAVAGSAS
jgi:hypothetical protein